MAVSLGRPTVTSMSDSAITRTLAAAAMPGAEAAILTAIPIYLATSGSISEAAWVLTMASAGLVIGFATAVPIIRVFPSLSTGRKLPAVLIGAWVGLSAVFLLTATHAPVHLVIVSTLAAVTGALRSLISVLNRSAAGRWGTLWLRRYGPIGRAGAAIGALLGAFVATSPIPPWVLALVLLVSVACPVLTHPASAKAGRHAWSWKVFNVNVAFSFAGYGPLVLQVVFVAATAGAAWAGVSMAVYAVFASIAPIAVRALPDRFHASPAAWLTLAGVANASWLLVLVHPVAGLLVSRAFSAVTLFAAEGSADVNAYGQGSLASALTGRAVGGVLAGMAGTLLLSAIGSVPATACLFALAAFTGAAAFAAASRLRQHALAASAA